VTEELVGNFEKKKTQKRRRPRSTDAEDCLNGKLHLILAHDGKVTKVCAVCSKQKSERRQKRNTVL
jgi:hypothetical protein